MITSSRLEPSDTYGDPNPSINERHAGPSASCSASTLTTRVEPSASATSPPAKSPYVRPSYGTPQSTPERQFPETRRLRGGGRGRDTGITRLRLKKTSHYMSLLRSQETVSEEPELDQHEPGRAGGLESAFALERVEHNTGEAFGPEGATSEVFEPKKSFVPEPEADESGEDTPDDESGPELDQGGQSGIHQEVPSAVRKLYDLLTSALQPITQRRTRSERDAASIQGPMRAMRQPFATGTDHAPRSTGVPGMAKLAARAEE